MDKGTPDTVWSYRVGSVFNLAPIYEHGCNMVEIVEKGLDLASEIFKYVNKKQSRKYIDQVVDLKMRLKNELSKPLMDQDDKVVETLRTEIEIVMDAAKQEIELIKNEAK